MEAVPRMPMLSFDLKNSPKSAEFTTTLKRYISSKYNEEPGNYSKQCQELDQLRENAVRVSHDFMGCSVLKKYYSQLVFLQSRFPLVEGDDYTITFTWEDAHFGVAIELPDIRFEQAAILYNIGALHSILGASDSRTSAEGMKISCTHFQCAAWAFQHLHDTYPSHFSQDMEHTLLNFQIQIMLAQAQECILEKSMADNRKSNITAKVAAQIVDYYSQANHYLDLFSSSPKRSKEWKKRLDLKCKYYHCIKCLYLGQQADEQQKYGERLTHYTEAWTKLEECQKAAKSDKNKEVIEALKFTADVIGGRYNNAKKENDFVYHDKVPEFSSLPEIKGASLVKGIAFEPYDEEISGGDIFAKLVPMEAHEASSLYSEEKAKLLRTIGEEIEDRDDELVQFLASLQLDQANLTPGVEALPEVLLEKCAEFSVKPDAIQDLVSAMQAISNLALDTEDHLRDIDEMIGEDAKKEMEYQEIFGKRAVNNRLIELGQEKEKYDEGHQKASKNNEDLHKAMNEHITRLKLLMGPLEHIQATLPTLEAARSSEDKVVIEKLLLLLNKVDEMKNQRQMLEGQIRKQIMDDDVTKILATKKDDVNLEDFFRENLKKHDQLMTYIRQNLSAQENILRALTDTNAEYAGVRKETAKVRQKRQEIIEDYLESFEVYEDLLVKSNKGKDFYSRLEANISALMEKYREIFEQRETERERFMAKIRPKVAPARPTAPKPNIPSEIPDPDSVPLPGVYEPNMGNIPDPDSLPLPGMNYLPGMANLPGMPPGMEMPPGMTGQLPDMTDVPQGLTLKDFLPFMKPRTFGNMANNRSSGASRTSQSDAMTSQAGMMTSQDGVVPSEMMTQSGMMTSSQAGAMGQQQGMYAQPYYNQAQVPGHPNQYLQQQPQYPGQFPVTGPAQSGAHGSRETSPFINRQNQPQHPPQNVPPQVQNSYHNQVNQGVNSAQPRMPPQNTVPQITPSPHQPGMSQSAMTADSMNRPSPQPSPSLPSLASQHVPAAGTGSVGGPNQSYSMSNNHLNSGQAQNYNQYSESNQALPPVANQNFQNGQNGSSSQLPPQIHSQQDFQNQRLPHPNERMGSGQRRPSPVSSPVGHVQPASVPQGYAPNASSVTVHGSNQRGMGQQPPQTGGAQQTLQSHGGVSQQHQQQQQQHQQQHQQQYQQQQYPMNPSNQYQSGQYGPQGPVNNQGQPQTHRMVDPANQIPGQQTRPQMGQFVPQQYGQPTPPGVSQPTIQQYRQTHPQQMSQQPVPSSTDPNVQHRQNTPTMMTAAPTQLGQRAPHNMNQPGCYHSGQQGFHPMGGQGPHPGAQQGPHTGGPQITQPVAQQVPQPHQGSQHGPRPGGQQGLRPGGQQGPHPGGQQGPHPGGQQGPHPGGQQGPHPSSQQGPHPVGSSGSVQIGQQMPHQIGRGVPPNQPFGPHSLQYQSGLPTSANQQFGYSGAPQHGQVPHQQMRQPSPPANPQTNQQVAPNMGQPSPGQQYQRPPQPHGQGGPRPVGQPNQQFAPQPLGQQPPAPMMCPPGRQPGPPAISGQQQQISGHPMGPGMPQQYTQPPHSHGSPQHVPQQHQNTVPRQNPGQMLPPGQTYCPPQASQSASQTSMGQSHYNPYPATSGPHGSPQRIPQQAGSPQPQRFMLPVNQNQGPAPGSQAPPSPQPPGPLPTPLMPSQPMVQNLNQAQPIQQQQQQPMPGQALPNQSMVPPTSFVRHGSVTSESSSTDDLLSSSPGRERDQENVLTPKVLTEEDKQRQKEEELREAMVHQHADPYTDHRLLDRFYREVQTYQTMVDSLTVVPQGGLSQLDMDWKELVETQEAESRKLSMAIARCYSMKNRSPDIMPYDDSRVSMDSQKDDYINASHMDSLASSCPKFIATQAPLPVTYSDFWIMVYEQGSEVVVMLLRDEETNKTKPHVYCPVEKGQRLSHGPIELTLQGVKERESWTERLITVCHRETRNSRTIIHLQFNAWPSSGVSESVPPLLEFINQVHYLYTQQRNLMKPVIVHCSHGIGRTGVFCVVYTAVQEMNQGRGVINVKDTVKKLRRRRKYMVEERDQYRLCYRAVLAHAQEILIRYGRLPKKQTGEKVDRTNSTGPKTDETVLGDLNTFHDIQSSVAKLSVKHINLADDTKNANDKSDDVASHDHVNVTLNDRPTSHDATRNGDVTTSTINDGVIATGNDVTDSSREKSNNSTSTSQHVNNRKLSSDKRSGSPVGGRTSSSTSRSNSPLILPPKLADLQDPNTFSLDTDESRKNKVTKSNFSARSGSLTTSTGDPNDPLSGLDPLWTTKKS